MTDLTRPTLADAQSDVIPALAGIHTTNRERIESCVGARLRGHDGRGQYR